MSKSYTSAEIRGQITSRQHEIEEIALRCLGSGFPDAADELAAASAAMTRAKLRVQQASVAREGES